MLEESLFAAALERGTASARRAFLDEACGGDLALRERVERLLAAHEKTVGILDEPVSHVAKEPVTGSAGSLGRAALEIAGTVLADRYKLIEEIGEGGMGSVWVAEQFQPVRRKVAIKLIRAGMDSKSVLARFDAERQALALMDHPNIAKVLDGGTTDAGRPFFVMEYVKGVPITQYCDNARLTVGERLALIMPVCQAVQHAHTKGIIHRDLKPSNILVCLYDGVPVPKVIDFGLAKAMHEPLTEQTLHTAHGVMLGTPLYMSPEQTEFNNIDVDTRTDIYALGVVLYELLTGTTPLERQRLQRAAWQEMLRLIREEEPQHPSARLSSSGSLPNVAANRQLEPVRLTKLVRGELDWIVMKCLEKDRARRYETANGLALDIRRFLDDDQVEACPPSVSYRLTKFIRRHRAILATATTIACVLVIASGVSIWQAIRATRSDAASRRAQDRAVKALDTARKAEIEAKARRDAAVAETKRADEERAVAQAVISFLDGDLLGQADIANQAVASERNREITVREVLDRASEGIENRFKGQEKTEAAIQLTIGKAYRAIGEYEKARKHLERSKELRRLKLGAENRDTLESQFNIALLLHDLGEYQESERVHLAVLEGRKRTLGSTHADTLQSMSDLGQLYCSLARYDEAERILQNVLEVRRSELGDDHLQTIESMAGIAFLDWSRGEYAAAEAWYRRAWEGLKLKRGADHPHTLRAERGLGSSCMMQNQLDEAERLFVEVLNLSRARLGPDHPDTLDVMHELAALNDKRDRHDQAASMYKEIIELQSAKYGADNLSTLLTMQNLGAHYIIRGLYKDAEPYLVHVLAVQRTKLESDHPETLITMHNLGVLYRDWGRYEQAEPLLREAATSAVKKLGLGHVNMPDFIDNFADLHFKRGTPEAAESLLREYATYLRDQPDTEPVAYAAQLGYLAENLRDQKKYEEAEPFARECLTIRAKHRPDSWTTFLSKHLVGSVLLGLKKYDEAAPLLVEGYVGMAERESKIPLGSKERLRRALECIVECYELWGKPEEAASWRAKLSPTDGEDCAGQTNGAS